MLALSRTTAACAAQRRGITYESVAAGAPSFRCVHTALITRSLVQKAARQKLYAEFVDLKRRIRISVRQPIQHPFCLLSGKPLGHVDTSFVGVRFFSCEEGCCARLLGRVFFVREGERKRRHHNSSSSAAPRRLYQCSLSLRCCTGIAPRYWHMRTLTVVYHLQCVLRCSACHGLLLRTEQGRTAEGSVMVGFIYG